MSASTASSRKGTAAAAASESSKITSANEADAVIIERLLQGAYHLPGNSYLQDLRQYFLNTHPLLGICFSHKLHPINGKLRLLFFVGSLAFGLAITNIIYVAFVIDNSKYDASYYSIQTNHTVTGFTNIDSQLTQINVTNGMIVLWTLGGVLNAFYDALIWTLASCKCFGKNEGGNDRIRFYVIMLIVLVVVTGSTLIVLVRATLESNQQTEEVATKLEIKYTPNAESYRFLVSYAVEVALSLSFWYFVIGFVLFTGVLGCFKYPILGGRPYEMKALEQERLQTPGESKSSTNV
ncbi:hypothetical protein MPSEU_000873800 [Mayamaea pseudoterrestris]|nr:hypothetical protein MPSEU_000873800 [Mayamaea pseudoterrestris]